MNRVKLALSSLLTLGLLSTAVGWLPAQDSPPKEPAKKDSPANGDEKGHANPLDDQKMQQNAKLGRILAKKRCVICHKVEGKGGILSPPMEQVTAARFQKMAEYGQHLANLKAKDPARYKASKKTFNAIEAEENRYQKLMLWLEGYLEKPTFDNGQAKMTKQVLKKHEIQQLIAYLLTLEPKEGDGAKP